MTGPAGIQQGRDLILQGIVGQQGTRGDLAINARQILHDHTPGPQVHMTNLGISHLPVRQPHFIARGLQKGLRTGRHHPVPVGRISLRNRIVRRIIPVAPAIQNTKHGRP